MTPAAPAMEKRMTDFSKGAAYLDGAYMPVSEARIPVTHMAYRRSDVTYDVVGVRDGNFFRLEDHLRRFRASMTALRMQPQESDDALRDILHRIVALAGLRDAYVAMDCLRGAAPPGAPRHSAFAPCYLMCYAVPWVSIASDQQIANGQHMIVAETRRISPRSVDPTVKNFHWGDLTRAQFEALDRGAETAVLLDDRGFITEGPGFNVFCIVDGKVLSPSQGALEGITRKSVFELCDELGVSAEITDIDAETFRNADEIFSCTTAGGIMPVSRIDGRIMNNDRPGPLSRRLLDRFWSRRAEGWHATPVDYARAAG